MVLKVNYLPSALYSKMSWAFLKTKEYSSHLIKEIFQNCCPWLTFVDKSHDDELEETYTRSDQLSTPFTEDLVLEGFSP